MEDGFARSSRLVRLSFQTRGTDKIEMIHMDFPKSEKAIKWDGEALRKMRKIKTLIIRQAHFSQGPKQLPNSLRVLKWQDYPSHSLPLDFHPEELVIFQLRGSNLMSVEFLYKQKFKRLTILNLDRSNIEEIPDVSGVPNLKELSFGHCGNLIKVHGSVGFLDELKLLSAEGCNKLRRFPPIKLTNLVSLNLEDCSALENFPEILGKMERIFNLYLRNTSIKELPSSIANLTNLIRLNMSSHSHGTVHLSSSIVMSPCLEDLQLQASEGFQVSEQDQGEEQGSSILSPCPKYVNLTNCNMSNECWPVVVAWFRNVVNLTLDRNNFTVLPESIQELCSLRFLSLTECNKLREIRGIPPNINEFFVRECISLTSSSRIMLLNEELHEDGNKFFYLPGSTIPEWFEHNNIQHSISFWFRNKLPEICLCLTGITTEKTWIHGLICNLFINGHEVSSYLPSVSNNHIAIFGLKRMRINHHIVANLLLENEWNHVACSFSGRQNIKQIGMHVVKHKSSMEDIRFTNPLSEELNEGDFQITLQLPNNLPSLDSPQCQQLSLHNPLAINSWDHPLTKDSSKENVSNSIAQIGISGTTDIQGPCLDNLCRLGLDYEAIELSCHDAPSKVDSDSDSIISSSLPSDAARKRGSGDDDLWRYGMELSLRPCWQAPLDCDNWNSSLTQLASANDTIRDEDKENTQVEPSQAAPSEIASGDELHLRTCCTVLPTTSDNSFRIQVDSSQDDDVEMENFYASLDAGTHAPSRSHDHWANTAPNEEGGEALRIVQDFITNNDASVFLDLEQCGAMKTSLDYLSNLSANGALPREMTALVSEASRVFTHCSSDYIEANMKIESGASELLKSNELEADLEDNKNQFMEIVALEKEQLQKLACLEESKKELEKQINALNANISVSQSEQNMTRKRKREIFEEGKALKTQVDKWKEKVSYLQHEQDLAKETQAKIKAKWSGLRQKFRKTIVEQDAKELR